MRRDSISPAKAAYELKEVLVNKGLEETGKYSMSYQQPTAATSKINSRTQSNQVPSFIPAD